MYRRNEFGKADSFYSKDIAPTEQYCKPVMCKSTIVEKQVDSEYMELNTTGQMMNAYIFSLTL